MKLKPSPTKVKELGLNELCEAAHRNSVDHGWWEAQRIDGRLNIGAIYNTIPEKIALMHSELSEALEDYRNGAKLAFLDEHGKPCGFATELADCVIRIADLCGALGIDLASVVAWKHAYNITRPHRHGGKAC